MKTEIDHFFPRETVFPIILNEKSSVSIDLYEENGKKLFSVIDRQHLSAGKQEVKISRNQLNSGKYTAKITIVNSEGELIQDLKITVN